MLRNITQALKRSGLKTNLKKTLQTALSLGDKSFQGDKGPFCPSKRKTFIQRGMNRKSISKENLRLGFQSRNQEYHLVWTHSIGEELVTKHESHNADTQ